MSAVGADLPVYDISGVNADKELKRTLKTSWR
jgi:hypothetical protein